METVTTFHYARDDALACSTYASLLSSLVLQQSAGLPSPGGIVGDKDPGALCSTRSC